MQKIHKLFLLLVTGVLLLAPAGLAADLNLVTNGTFDANDSGWTLENIDPLDDFINVAWIGTDGNPPGAVKLERTNVLNPSDDHRYIQSGIPVTVGNRYYFRGQWKGDLASGYQGRSWAEVYVGFYGTGDPNIAGIGDSVLRYTKIWDGVNNQNVAADGQWGWEDIQDSSFQGTPPRYVPQESQENMYIAFNIGGEDLTGSATQKPYFIIDNIKIIECQAWLNGDTNDDCQVDITDLAVVIDNWLNCNLDPQSSCWQ